MNPDRSRGNPSPRDLFRGAAGYYAAFRRPYPPAVVSYLADAFGLDGRGRLLDGGCGTGQAFSVLAGHFAETVAFDANPDMVALARETAASRNLSSVRVSTMKAEELRPDAGPFRLAVFAASFHWMDRPRVAELVYDLLEPSGHIVVIAPSALHVGDGPLETAIRETIAESLAPERTAGAAHGGGERHATALARTRFGLATTVDIDVEETWTVQQVVGWLYSTSFANKSLLREKAADFEANLSRRLRQRAPSGRFVRTTQYTVISAERKASGDA